MGCPLNCDCFYGINWPRKTLPLFLPMPLILLGYGPNLFHLSLII